MLPSSGLRRCVVSAVAVLLAIAPVALTGQTPSSQAGTPAGTYLDAYREIERLAPVPGQVADVERLTLTRDAGRLLLERGRLYLLSPVGGRTVGAFFRGEGRFTFAPGLPTEQAELRRFADSTALDAPFDEVVILFADSTLDQLRGLTFGPGTIPDDITGRVRDVIGSLKGDHEGSFDSDVIGPLLNSETTGFFLARVARRRGDPVLFQFNPAVAEAVQLYRPVSRRRFGGAWALVSQAPPLVPLPRSNLARIYRERLRVPDCRLDVSLRERVNADISLAASATVSVVAEEPVGPWLLFGLHWKLEADSARWGGGTGERAAYFKADESGALWVRAERRLQPGDSLLLTLYYHGNLIDRYGNFFFVDPFADWYPVNRQGPNLATFDLTYHSPARYPLVSLGELRDSSVADRVRTTHWVVGTPTEYPTFNLGLFETYRSQQLGAPPLEIVWSDDAHRELRRLAAEEGVVLAEQRNMRENVAVDVSNSLRLYASLFGEAVASRFAVTEMPYGGGVAFPGLIQLSWSTFQNTTLDGFDEFLRAHEVAHQWWGIGVRPASYRDAWLSEGLATLTGLWYLQTQRGRNNEYYHFLDQYRSDIAVDREATGAIWIGYRNSTPDVPRGYQVMIYEKGAWVFQMLRAMMLDLGTLRADRFTAMLRDYYRMFRGTAASTVDFQAVVERHVGAPMGWFFDQWVKGTAIPTYRVAWTSQQAADGRYQVRLRVAQEGVPADFQMPVVVAVDLGDQRTARFRVRVSGARGEYLSPLLPARPRSLVFNDLHSVLGEVRMEGW